MWFQALLSRFVLACLPALLYTVPAVGQSGRYDVFVSSRGNHSVKRYDGETGAYLGDFLGPAFEHIVPITLTITS